MIKVTFKGGGLIEEHACSSIDDPNLFRLTRRVLLMHQDWTTQVGATYPGSMPESVLLEASGESKVYIEKMFSGTIPSPLGDSARWSGDFAITILLNLSKQ